MEKNEIKLSEFLKDNGAYDKFVKNFDRDYTSKKGFIRISNAFDWETSPEGYTYWDGLDDRWNYTNFSKDSYDMDWLLEGKEVEQDTPKIKTNIKMRVTPEQYIKVLKICFTNNIFWCGGRNSIEEGEYRPFIWILNDISFSSEEQYFMEDETEEVDADLFIRTNGTCIEDIKQEETPQPETVEKEYLVYVQNKGVPKVKHNLQSAGDEAKRLASIEIGKEVHIVEIIKTYKANVIVEEIK